MAAAQETPTGQRPADAPLAAQAQTEAAPAQPAEEVVGPTPKKSAEEEIVVTGTRIRRKDLTTPAPIAVINKEEMQASGKVNIGDFLQQLPEQGNAINTSFNNGGNGATRVNLRSLGVSRTLVLLNGRRFVPGGTGADASVDLNSIPSSIIERVEVLKDGASAIYGSDAIAGVVNLITRKRMNGVEATGYLGTSTHADGTTYDLNVTAGTSGDRGSILFTAGYFTQYPVFAGERSWSAKPISLDYFGTQTQNGQPGVYTNGSPTGPIPLFEIPTGERGRLLPNPTNDPRIAFYNSLMTKFPTVTRFIRDPNAPDCLTGGPAGTCFRPYRNNRLPEEGGDGYNFAPTNYLVTPLHRISMFTIGEAKISDYVRGYFEGAFVNRQSDQQLAEEPVSTANTGVIGRLNNVIVSANNFYNPFGRDFDPVLGANVSRRMTQFGPRRTFQDIDSIRIVAGIDGSLPEEAGFFKGWFWDISLNYGRTQGTVVNEGNLRVDLLQNAVGPTSRDAQGNLHCGTGIGPNGREQFPGCVPFDILGGPEAVTQGVQNYLTYTGVARGTNQLTAVQFNTSGELFKLYADRPVGIAAGYEYRIVAGENIPEVLTISGQGTGNAVTPTSGHYYVNEGYGELSIPIASGQQFLHELEATAAIRAFDYSNFGSDFTYKFGGRWSVIPDFTVRGTYSTAFRAPSVADLFLGIRDSFPLTTDPCAPANAPASCGPAAGNGDPRAQLREQLGGNPKLGPETAKIYTVGVVIEPRPVKNLSITADYYHIKVDNAIVTVGATTILNGCYTGGNQAFCNLIIRNPVSQRIDNILDLNQNVGGDEVAGVDFGLNYAVPTAYGRFSLLWDGTYLQRWTRTQADGSEVRQKGNYDLRLWLPSFKFNGGLRWNYEGVLAGVNTRWSSSYNECGTAAGLFNGSGQCRVNSNNVHRVPYYNVWDVFLGYTFSGLLGKSSKTSLTAGVNNIFDKQPQFVYNAQNNQSDPTAYDYVGRFFYGRLTQAF
jgi:outer membrane receptor protein involved in Fe transport